jgi:hypothetical protein
MKIVAKLIKQNRVLAKKYIFCFVTKKAWLNKIINGVRRLPGCFTFLVGCKKLTGSNAKL